MNEIKEKNQNLETLENLKVIISATFALYIRILTVLTIIGLSYLAYHILSKFFDLSSLYSKLIIKLNTPTGLWTGVLAIFITGILLALFRSKQKFWYGFFETIFALVSCYFVVKSIKPSSEVISVLLIIGSTLYLIVRGFSNLLEGVKKQFWLKNELVRLSNNMNSISSKSITKMLKDEEVIVKILTVVIKFVVRFI